MKSESYSNNYKISKVSNEVFLIEKMLLTESDYTKSKSYNDICNKNYYNVSNRIRI